MEMDGIMIRQGNLAGRILWLLLGVLYTMTLRASASACKKPSLIG
jgi:hypothetical protein